MIFRLLELVTLFWGEAIGLAAHLVGKRQVCFVPSSCLKRYGQMVPLLPLLPQELHKNFLPELVVAYDILAFILPNRVVGGFVWELL